jgi:predicted dithiol-disulfide oxidoreductase (DUF899 family)
MGWEMPWYTITNGFDADFGVDEWHGHNVFFRDGKWVFRPYFINGRGDEAMGTTWSYLDITPLGRQETWEDSPTGWPQRFKGKQAIRTDGRPTAQWSRLKAGYSDDLGTGRR